MDARLQQRVQRYGWDRAASTYEQSWQKQLEPAQARLMQMAALQAGERVLDLACGTGDLCRTLADGGLVPIGADFSAGMLHAARTVSPPTGIAVRGTGR